MHTHARCTHTHTMHTHTHTCTHTHICTHTHTHTHEHLNTHTYTHTHTYTFARPLTASPHKHAYPRHSSYATTYSQMRRKMVARRHQPYAPGTARGTRADRTSRRGVSFMGPPTVIACASSPRILASQSHLHPHPPARAHWIRTATRHAQASLMLGLLTQRRASGSRYACVEKATHERRSSSCWSFFEYHPSAHVDSRGQACGKGWGSTWIHCRGAHNRHSRRRCRPLKKHWHLT